MTAEAMPKRIQLRRTKGWRKPEWSVVVARPSKWGNPFVVGNPSHVDGMPMTAAEAVSWYRRGLEGAAKACTGDAGSIFTPEMTMVYSAWEDRAPHLHAVDLDISLNELKGKDLCCWCKLCPAHADGKPLGVECPDCAPCHADVLLEVSNAVESS